MNINITKEDLLARLEEQRQAAIKENEATQKQHEKDVAAWVRGAKSILAAIAKLPDATFLREQTREGWDGSPLIDISIEGGPKLELRNVKLFDHWIKRVKMDGREKYSLHPDSDLINLASSGVLR